MTGISPIRQAAIRGLSQHPVQLLAGGTTTVVAQHIALVRIDVQPAGKARKAVLNLYGPKDVDRLIEALQAAKARLVQEQEALRQYWHDHPEAVA
jgi:hypothetical protein